MTELQSALKTAQATEKVAADALTLAERKLSEVTAELERAEASYAEDAGDRAWFDVQAARDVFARAELEHKNAESRANKAREAVARAERSLAMEQYEAALARSSESAVLRAIKPTVLEVIACFRKLGVMVATLENAVKDAQAAHAEATRLGRVLNQSPPAALEPWYGLFVARRALFVALGDLVDPTTGQLAGPVRSRPVLMNPQAHAPADPDTAAMTEFFKGLTEPSRAERKETVHA